MKDHRTAIRKVLSSNPEKNQADVVNEKNLLQLSLLTSERLTKVLIMARFSLKLNAKTISTGLRTYRTAWSAF